jgi:hypothetical protein
MKRLIFSVSACLLVLPFTAALAGTVEEELKQLHQQRQNAVAAAVEPIDRKYEEALEQMLKRALQSRDVEGAVKVQALLSSQPKEVAKQLAGTWTMVASTGYTAEITFRDDGTANYSGIGSKMPWRIDDGVLLLGSKKMEEDRFLLPVKDGVLKGNNIHGNTLTLTKK